MAALATLGGALIGGASSIAGGVLSGSRNQKLSKDFLDWQKTLAQSGIRMRVADAKAAGLHPLFALGAAPQSSAPAVIGDTLGTGISEAGQHVGGAVSRLPGRSEKKERGLRMQLLESQIAETDARKNLLDSEAARNKQAVVNQATGAATQLGVMQEGEVPFQPTQPPAMYKSPGEIFESHGPMEESWLQQFKFKNQPHPDLPGAGYIQRTPSEVTTHKPGNRGLVAGEHPGFKEYRLPNGLPIMLPAGDSLSEVLEETPWWMFKSIFEMNKRKYGADWGNKMLRFLWKGE